MNETWCRKLQQARFACGLFALLLSVGCEPDAVPASTSADTIVLRLPPALGWPERLPVAFAHDRHTKALAADRCSDCHPKDGQGRVLPQSRWTLIGQDAGAWTAAFHSGCIGCHEQRRQQEQTAGPIDCSGCHATAEDAAGVPPALRYTYDLHGRHVAALGEPADKTCQRCHHVFDKVARKLVYRQHEEGACRDCHASVAKPYVRALGDAVHLACVDCHRRMTSPAGHRGPQTCAGCHETAARQQQAQKDPVTRLVAGQKDAYWVTPAAADRPGTPVAFSHKAHENADVAPFCTTCHHRTIQSCSHCHTALSGSAGGGVTLEQAFHRATAQASCVGCHAQKSQQAACVGCHAALPPPPAEVSCAVCHRGPARRDLALVDPQVVRPPLTKTVLPMPSDEFPKTVRLAALAQKYLPVELPHARIVKALVDGLGDNRLAQCFHSDVKVLCGSCHHHQPSGTSPQPCSACHGRHALPATDQPDLRAAYHRMCLGCHQRSGRPTTCVTCHRPAGPVTQKGTP